MPYDMDQRSDLRFLVISGLAIVIPLRKYWDLNQFVLRVTAFAVFSG